MVASRRFILHCFKGSSVGGSRVCCSREVGRFSEGSLRDHDHDVFVDNYPSQLKPWTLLNFARKLGYVPAQTFCQGVLTM